MEEMYEIDALMDEWDAKVASGEKTQEEYDAEYESWCWHSYSSGVGTSGIKYKTQKVHHDAVYKNVTKTVCSDCGKVK